METSFRIDERPAGTRLRIEAVLMLNVTPFVLLVFVILTYIFSAFVAPVFAADGATTPVSKLDPVIVTATRSSAEGRDVPYTVQVIGADTFQLERPARTLPEVFRSMPSIMVQKTGHGQGSPYLRGFTGFRTLFMVDGVRLNNSTFRDGPNQYWNTVDPMTLASIEVVMGPASVLYGSDAIGGTVNALTRDMTTVDDTSSRLYLRYADAERARVVRAEFGARLDRLSLRGGLTVKDFGDLVGGSDVGVQARTGYDERNADAKLRYRNDRGDVWTLAWQQVNQDDAWRTHRTIYGIRWHGTEVGDEQQRILDQDRQLGYLKFESAQRAGPVQRFDANLSFQAQNETRDRIRASGRRDFQGANVDTLGLSLQMESETASGPWIYGMDFYRDSVDSFRRDFNADGSLRSERIQGPVADEAHYDLLGVFAQKQLTLARAKLTVGGRYTYARADADRVEDPLTGAAIAIDDHWSAVTWSARFSLPSIRVPGLKAYGGISQGFRAPNLSDLTRFDSARSNEIETPVRDLDAEDFISYEAGLRYAGSAWYSQLAVYYNDISNMIIRAPTGRMLDGDFEITKRNAGDGYVKGVELQTSYAFATNWRIRAALAWMDGEVDSFPLSDGPEVREPLDRLMPLNAHLSIDWRSANSSRWASLSVTGAEGQDDLSTRDRSDTQRIPPDGTPGYASLDIAAGLQLMQGITLSLSVENLLNRDFRIHGSGVNEPGRNVILGLDGRF